MASDTKEISPGVDERIKKFLKDKIGGDATKFGLDSFEKEQ
jgi:hypothetical protein